ncbi:TetR/AcrR family transcriptional regulator [Photobacterium sp. R1]
MTDKKERILQATEELLAKHGFHGLSMNMVAKEAKVATGTIYRYFTDKDDLLYQLHDHILTIVAQKITQNISDVMPLELRFRTMWLNIWNMATDNEAPLINQGQFENMPHRGKQYKIALEKTLFAPIDRMFEEGKAQGLFKPLDNEILAALSLEPCAALARKHLTGTFTVSDEARDAAINACWDAVITH